MSLLPFLPHLARLRLLEAVIGANGLVLTLAARLRTAPCPLCGRRARRVQSRYARRVADLPIAGQRVSLRLQVRRFFCRNRRCPRVIFAERFPELVPAYGRRTVAHRAQLQELGCQTGGSVGARLARALGLSASACRGVPPPPAGRCAASRGRRRWVAVDSGWAGGVSAVR